MFRPLDCLPLLDRSDRLEPLDHVSVIAAERMGNKCCQGDPQASKAPESTLTITSRCILHDKLEVWIIGVLVIEFLQFILVLDSLDGAPLNKSNTNVLRRRNVEQAGNLECKIIPTWPLIKICKLGLGTCLLEPEFHSKSNLQFHSVENGIVDMINGAR